MARYTYTGNVTDLRGAAFPGASPRAWVTTDRDVFTPGGLGSHRDVRITVESNGSFDVTLEASADLTPPSPYTIRCEWFTVTENGQEVLAGWSEWTFTAQIGGGPVSTMPGVKLTRVWYSPLPPPVSRTGIYWLDPETGDVRIWKD